MLNIEIDESYRLWNRYNLSLQRSLEFSDLLEHYAYCRLMNNNYSYLILRSIQINFYSLKDLN